MANALGDLQVYLGEIRGMESHAKKRAKLLKKAVAAYGAFEVAKPFWTEHLR